MKLDYITTVYKDCVIKAEKKCDTRAYTKEQGRQHVEETIKVIGNNPGITKTHLVDAMTFSKHTLKKCLDELLDLGSVKERKQGSTLRYWLVE